MTHYRNLNGNSNVEAYEIFTDKIEVKFHGTFKTYTYSYWKAGKNHVENLKALASRGYGLNSYIDRYCKYLYD